MSVASRIDPGQNDCPKTNARFGSPIGLSFYVSCFPNIQVPSLNTRPRGKAVGNDQGSQLRAYVARSDMIATAHLVTVLQLQGNPKGIYGGNMNMRRIIPMRLELMQLY